MGHEAEKNVRRTLTTAYPFNIYTYISSLKFYNVINEN